MEQSSLYFTPKRKFSLNSSLEESPEEKRIRESTSPDAATPIDKGEVMAASKLTEDFGEKLDLIFARLSSLDVKMEDLNSTVKSLKSKIYQMDTEIDSVKSKHKKLDEKFSHMETNASLVDECIKDLNSKLEERKDEINQCHQKMLYLEAYSRRENLKFEGIAEAPQDNAASSSSEETKDVLVDFLENVLEIEDAKSIEFQRVHRLGKSNRENATGGRTIIARFLRYSDKERVFKQGRKLKGTNFRMFEDIPKELHQKRKAQMERLKEARKEGRRANFSKSEPDKLYIDGKYVKM